MLLACLLFSDCLLSDLALVIDPKHLHDAETRLYCPQTFLTMYFPCMENDVSGKNRRFGIQKSNQGPFNAASKQAISLRSC